MNGDTNAFSLQAIVESWLATRRPLEMEPQEGSVASLAAYPRHRPSAGAL